jgi:hypothetical protein
MCNKLKTKVHLAGSIILISEDVCGAGRGKSRVINYGKRILRT